MANYKGISADPISVLAGWEEWNGAAWVAASVIPSAGDVAYANGFNKEIDQNWTVDEIRNNVFQGTTGSGRFELLSAGITFSGVRFSNGPEVLFISFGGGESTVLGQGFTQATGASLSVLGLSGGILNLEYSGIGSFFNRIGTVTVGHATGTGFTIIATNITGNLSVEYGILLSHNNYTVINQGICVAGPSVTGYGILNNGAGNTIINNGIILGSPSSTAVGVFDQNGCTLINNGIIQATSFAAGFAARGPISNAGTFYKIGTFVACGTLIDTVQFNAVMHSNWKLLDVADGDMQWQMKTPANADRYLYTAGLLTGFPPESKVEDGEVYGPSGEFTGELSPVVVNTAQLASDLFDAIIASSDPLAVRLKNTATVSTVNDAVASLNVIVP